MSLPPRRTEMNQTSERADELFREHQQTIFIRTDRMFAALLLFQWVACIATALWISPRTWVVSDSQIHPHVWVAVFLAGIIITLPIALAILKPGKAITRHTIAFAQMMISAILIHLSGGRIETHFHIFGSLAFLAFYRDWRVLITATVVVTADHLLRGIYWPQSIYGVLSGEWRWLEHAGWVVFEDVFLIRSCWRGTSELREIATRTAQLESTNAAIEKTVVERTDKLRASEAELQRAKEAAEAANRSKSAFLANMSHEIRTPMTAIMGYTETLLEPDQTESERKESLQVIRRSARHLLDLINDILDISKIEAGKMTIERVEMNLPQVAADVTSLMRSTAIAKGLTCNLVFGDTVARTILSDPVRIKQVLMNLLGNAVKFTKLGEVRLQVSSTVRDGSCICVFEVIDSGIGMSDEQIERIFQPFTQADDSTTRQFGGTGLGLTISRRLAELLGGELTVDSLPGVGSRFRFEVDGGPADRVELVRGLTESLVVQSPEVADAQREKLDARILLAEDGLDNQRLISMFLRKAGAEVVIAENGRIAVEMAHAEPFDLILMDMQMPELDGYEATQQLRSEGCTLPIVALTAHAMAEDRDKCLAAGCTEFLTKPVDRNTLLNSLAKFLSSAKSGPAAALADQGSPGQSTGREVLVSAFADDPDMEGPIGEFVATLPRRMAEVRELLNEQNMPELRRIVHQLKGAGGGYGFNRVTDVAAAVERVLDQEQPLATLRVHVDELVATVGSIEGYQHEQEVLCV